MDKEQQHLDTVPTNTHYLTNIHVRKTPCPYHKGSRRKNRQSDRSRRRNNPQKEKEAQAQKKTAENTTKNYPRKTQGAHFTQKGSSGNCQSVCASTPPRNCPNGESEQHHKPTNKTGGFGASQGKLNRPAYDRIDVPAR